MEQNLWRAIPSSAHVVGVRRSRPNLPRKAKVSNFHELRSVAEQVFRLQVAMKESVTVHERESSYDLQQNHFDCVLGEVCIAVLDELVEILLHELEDEVENVVFPYDLLQLYDVGVGKLFQGLRKRKF